MLVQSTTTNDDDDDNANDKAHEIKEKKKIRRLQKVQTNEFRWTNFIEFNGG